ncbi:unnamed protein product [Linum tenue]|uniref:Receptor-like serine/threonine-protein kinase n=1 Tax=Linum tenue TaxID=586396 RepID=A0AAV0JDJ6_9ROSI|nr:unnamed protein product [Linum tenue]
MDLAEGLFISLLLQLIISLSLCSFSSTDTISFNESLADGQVLVSNGERYTLGFFSPGKSSNRYLGIWYTKVSVQTVVWVANRDNPIDDTSGLLLIDRRGDAVLQRGRRNISSVWSTNISAGGSSMAKLLDDGNFVILQQDAETVLWQSFDHPTDTIFPNMKFGLDRKTGLIKSARSWKAPDDPATGNWSYYLDPDGVPQLMLYQGQTRWWRSGPWNGNKWSGIPEMSRTFIFNTSIVNNESESSVVWGILDPNIISRLYLDPTGFMKRATWHDQDSRWIEFWTVPKEPCDYYGHCGPNGKCDPYDAGVFECNCLPGFEPRSPNDWFLRDASAGCIRKRSGNNSRCGDGRLTVGMDMNMCRQECLRNCSCTAYASSNLTSRIGCITLHGDLMDTRVFSDGGQDLYVRVDAIELEYMERSKGHTRKKELLAIVLSSIGVAFILAISTVYCLRNRKRNGKQSSNYDAEKENSYEDKDSSVPIFDVNDIYAATENFSMANKLGQGGFGSVYKGLLSNGQEIAVKRLSQTSRQGILEFKNEVKLVSKLQHKNLARLFGCCIHDDEKMLVYEYLPNRSLDFFIFDLKASNVLLDAAMNPKISDFGLARLFMEDQMEANTNRVVGTYGYMSPEYAMEGLYSTKSDVFSFGVLTLEIVSSKRSNHFYQESTPVTLTGHVWDLWREARALDIMDSSTMGESYSTDQVTRCIQIGLLCVQELTSDRPTMSNVVFMLSNATTLPSPKKPAFVLLRTKDEFRSSTAAVGSTDPSTNRVSVTTLEARW